MTNHEPGTWHREVIPPSTGATLGVLCDAHLLDVFYLAGGTGLALQFGHRLSRDLDFFTREHFDEEALLQGFQAIEGFSLVAKAPFTVHATVQGTKISFLGYAYPLLRSFRHFEGVSVADPRDIACMKISAIASRGAKRDFIDLHACAQQFGLQEILWMFDRKFEKTPFSRIHILKSLTFFADAEKDPTPHMLIHVDWDMVKAFFTREVPRLL